MFLIIFFDKLLEEEIEKLFLSIEIFFPGDNPKRSIQN